MKICFLAADDLHTPFPPLERAFAEPNGLLMAGASLAPERLLAAYYSGIFPWYEQGEPVLWWSPDPRCILLPERIRIRRSLAKRLKRQDYTVTDNQAFRQVMQQCAAPRRDSFGTWITQDMVDAYCELHRRGHARSVEVWQNGELVGGLYGIALQQLFVGESMFSRASDASKVALVHLAQGGQYQMIDCQLATDHLLSMGAENISRASYLARLRSLAGSSPEASVRALMAPAG